MYLERQEYENFNGIGVLGEISFAMLKTPRSRSYDVCRIEP
jgi:hypothetical protein